MGMLPARRNTASSQSAPPAAMEARSVDAIPRGSEWQYEPKWNGCRCLLSRHGDKVELRSKSGEDLPRYFTELVPRHSDYDWLILSQFRMGRSSGATRIWMLRATPG